MTRLGIAFLSDMFSTKDIIKYAMEAEEKGYESIWIAEHYFYRDAFSILGSIALKTKRIRLATGVINPYTRHPALIAMTIATLDELSNGRAILGIGTGVPYWIKEQMGINMKNPVLTMRESILIIKKLLTGENVTYAGKSISVRGIQIGFRVAQSNIPIYLAAIGKKMLQLAGEVADGVIFTAGCSLKYVKSAIDNIKMGARKVGRDLSDIDIAALLICSVHSDSKKAKDATRELVALLLARPGRARLMLEEEKLNEKLLCLIKKEVCKGNLKKASTYLTESMIESVTVSGTPQECRQKIQEFIHAKINLPILLPVSGEVSAVLDLI